MTQTREARQYTSRISIHMPAHTKHIYLPVLFFVFNFLFALKLFYKYKSK